MAEVEVSFLKTLASSTLSVASAAPHSKVTKNLSLHKDMDVDDVLYRVVEYVLRDTYDDSAADIDADDVDNELAAVDYVKDMYSFYDFTEDEGRVVEDYMGWQTEINYESRAVLVGWLIKVHEELELMPEVLYLAVNIFDRVLSVMTVPSRWVLVLVAITSMLIACKYEQDQWTPRVSHFIAKSGNCYYAEDVRCMEKAILGKLEWNLTVPTPYVYLVRFIKASIPNDEEMENLVFFYAELGLSDYWTVISYRPSLLAASAVYAARCTLMRSPLWTDTLKHYTGYSEDQLVVCARLLVGFHSSSIGAAGNNDLQLKFAVSRKYSKPERGVVALFPPARNLVPSWIYC